MPPEPPLAARLAACRRRWAERWSAFAEWTPPPWWSPGVQLTPDLRQTHERYLPAADFLADLGWLLSAALPHPSWLPVDLKQLAYPSLPDLWAQLPVWLAGRVVFDEGELAALACALASPARFGTEAGRYPEQAAMLASVARSLPASCRALDLGCGTGQGTWELAGRLAIRGTAPTVIGVTREPLEAWMAANRRLPHRPEQRFPDLPRGGSVRFLAGDARHPPVTGKVDLIVCNGLLGGPALADEPTLLRTIERLASLLVPNGWLLVGDRFHGGHRAATHVPRLLAGRFGPPVTRAGPSTLWRKAP